MKNKLTRQEFALKYPYSSPMDFNPGVRKIVHVGNTRISSVLCVDAFPDEPVWHASGVLLDSKMAGKPLENTTPAEFKTLSDHLLRLLENVGQGDPWTSQPMQMLHAYRKLSTEELSKIKKHSGQKPEDFYSSYKDDPPEVKELKIPENMILRLKEDEEISTAGRLEAEMTFMKTKQPNPKNTEAVYMYPELIKSKEDLFLFAMTFGMHLNGLNEGTRKVNPEVQKMFDSKNN